MNWASLVSENIHYVGETGSTNEDVKSWAQRGRAHGATLFAGRQSAGRGRLGRVWESASDQGLLGSILLRPNLLPRHVPLVCLAAAIAVTDVAGRGDLKIKWPNDVLDGQGKKVCGILAEVGTDNRRISWVVVGIGLNVISAPIAQAGYLQEDGEHRDLPHLAQHLTQAVLARVEQLRRPQTICDLWKERSHTLNRRVRVSGVEGLAINITERGGLIVRTDSGEERTIMAGDVQMLKTTNL